MIDPEQRHPAALERFLAAHDDIRQQLDQLNPLEAQAAGLTAGQYRAERLHEAFEMEAERQGLFAWELTLQLTTDSPEDFQAQRLEVHKEVAEMAGMDWDEYRGLYGL
ncbi:DUF6388 family protein [Pseudomonas sp. M47T1]|uniref:DUF6388 family protein n=1 Tax=Pseudomonas sp. M47T1 TaxID=1179778 RepID=UPI0002DE0A01|nr:DUF6388 family protein [Pseudomonas sp. M47T1]